MVPGYGRIKVVHGFDELVTTPLAGELNALCWARQLQGDFREVVEQLGPGDGVDALDEARLRNLKLSAAGRAAVDVLLEDQHLLRERGLTPQLDCVRGYDRDDAAEVVPTDVYSFHVDRATDPADTYLCTYYGPASEGLRLDEARRRVEIPETRARLLKEFGGAEGREFRDFLSARSYDLHYVPRPGARPFPLGVGNLWRVAVDYPGNPVPAFIHRAPDTEHPRLLLIS